MGNSSTTPELLDWNSDAKEAFIQRNFAGVGKGMKALLGKMTDADLRAIHRLGLRIVPPPAGQEREPAIFVERIPSGFLVRKLGFGQGNRYLGWVASAETSALLDEWEDSVHRKHDPRYTPPEHRPRRHATLAFGLDPEAHDTIAHLLRHLPREPLPFGPILALGLKGQENVWASHLLSEPLRRVMNSFRGSRADTSLSTYRGGYRKHDHTFSDSVPHVTALVGVKNLTGRPADPYACPPAGYLAGRTATFDYAMVSVALRTPDTCKPFKVCRVYDLQPE